MGRSHNTLYYSLSLSYFSVNSQWFMLWGIRIHFISMFNSIASPITNAPRKILWEVINHQPGTWDPERLSWVSEVERKALNLEIMWKRDIEMKYWLWCSQPRCRAVAIGTQGESRSIQMAVVTACRSSSFSCRLHFEGSKWNSYGQVMFLACMLTNQKWMENKENYVS